MVPMWRLKIPVYHFRSLLKTLEKAFTCLILISRLKIWHSFDVVVGPIADDGVAYQLRRYTSGIIPMNKLIEELKFSKGMTIQYFFGSEKVLSFLKKV